MRPGGRLPRSWKDGRTGVAAFLDDYAFLAAGLLDLYEATFDARWLGAALAIADDDRAPLRRSAPAAGS